MKRGFALIIVLATMILVTLGTATVLRLIGSQADLKSLNYREVRTWYLAEAGLVHAMWRCRTSNCATETINIDGERVSVNANALPRIRVEVDYT